MKSWKTTALGILVLIGALSTAGIALLDGDPNTTVNTEQVLTAFAGVGLLFARDNNVSSEQAGVK